MKQILIEGNRESEYDKMEYFTFPMETMNVTQTYLGKTSHYLHTTGIPKDYPIDCAGIDANQSAIFAPVDMQVTAKFGIGNDQTNTVWLVSTAPVITPSGISQVFMTLTHWNDDDPFMKKWNVGAVIPKGEIICGEGTDGASANHIHLVVGVGYSDNWTKSSTGKWVIIGDTRKPEEIMYINPSFTNMIKNNGGLSWKEIPKKIGNPVSRDETRDQLQVNVDNAYARDSAAGNILGYINPGIYNSLEVIAKDGYEWHRVEENIWIANGSWCTWLPKKEKEAPQVIADLQNKIAEKEKEIEELKKIVTERDLEIENLKWRQEQSGFKKFIASKNAKYYIYLYKNEILNYEIKG